MGWSSGSELAQRLWNKIKPLIKDEKDLAEAKKAFIKEFEDRDCDTIEEVEW